MATSRRWQGIPGFQDAWKRYTTARHILLQYTRKTQRLPSRLLTATGKSAINKQTRERKNNTRAGQAYRTGDVNTPLLNALILNLGHFHERLCAALT